uniref:Uncharacterized protein n=1 Tax=Arabidopsis thaliana TaxID=3702 RepID=Q56XX0_ARATH|nr:hypothetical protein [Arabidopsis thaliana]
MRKLCVSDVDDEFADEVVSSEARGSACRVGLLEPEGSRITDE